MKLDVTRTYVQHIYTSFRDHFPGDPVICVSHNNDWHNCDWLSFTFNIHTVFWCSKCRWQAKDRTLETRTHTQLSFFYRMDAFLSPNQLNGSVKEPICSTSLKLRKSLVKPVYSRIYRVVSFFHLRLSCGTHLILFSERLPIYASCMTISGGRTL